MGSTPLAVTQEDCLVIWIINFSVGFSLNQKSDFLSNSTISVSNISVYFAWQNYSLLQPASRKCILHLSLNFQQMRVMKVHECLKSHHDIKISHPINSVHIYISSHYPRKVLYKQMSFDIISIFHFKMEEI